MNDEEARSTILDDAIMKRESNRLPQINPILSDLFGGVFI